MSYLAGYVLQSLYRKSKNSPHWNSLQSQQLQALLQCLKLIDSQDDEYINSLSRGGLWAPIEPIKAIAMHSEMTFRKHLSSKKDLISKIPKDEVVDEVMQMPVVRSLWENIIIDVDVAISSEYSKLVLENFVKLYVQVRCFSYAKDFVHKYNLKEKTLKKKALRHDLKKRTAK